MRWSLGFPGSWARGEGSFPDSDYQLDIRRSWTGADLCPGIPLVAGQNTDHIGLLSTIFPSLCILHCCPDTPLDLDYSQWFGRSTGRGRREDVDRVVEIVNDQCRMKCLWGDGREPVRAW